PSLRRCRLSTEWQPRTACKVLRAGSRLPGRVPLFSGRAPSIRGDSLGDRHGSLDADQRDRWVGAAVIMRAVLINLDRSQDRLAAMTTEFLRVGLDFDRFSAVDGIHLPGSVRP